MFIKENFKIFDVEGLDSRMAAIRESIQPVFRSIWENFCPRVSKATGLEFHIHIAQHLRRTTNPPESTWSAISTTKRGYKNQPHFQLGIWREYIFIYLSMIDNPKNEKEIADTLLKNIDVIKSLPEDFIYSADHTKKEVFSVSSENLEKDIVRFRDVKKSEFEVGRIIEKESNMWNDTEKAKAFLWETIEELLPLYQILAIHIE